MNETRARRFIPLLTLVITLGAGTHLGAAAQPSPERWEKLDVDLDATVRSIHIDRRGLFVGTANTNVEDARSYPLVRLLVNFADVYAIPGLGDPYRSLIQLVALDCDKKRAQDVQMRYFEEADGRKQTLVSGTLSVWHWTGEASTHPTMAKLLFKRFCPPADGAANTNEK